MQSNRIKKPYHRVYIYVFNTSANNISRFIISRLSQERRTTIIEKRLNYDNISLKIVFRSQPYYHNNKLILI